MLKSISDRLWFTWGSLLILMYLFIRFVSVVFQSVSEVYVDPDQLLMMFATQEFLEGRFHMPRFFGQDYGSMLEAFVAIPFTPLGLETALPLATCILWLLPYALIVHFFAKSDTRAWLMAIVWLFILPVEYVFLGTMPRDFVTGIAITGLALPFINRRENWAMVLFGFFCLMGWSINQNAVLFGASITIFKVLSVEHSGLRSLLWISSGYALGMLVHLGLGNYISLHPEWIVHEAWDTRYNFTLFLKAFTQLDVHWGALTPLGYKMSWTYIVCFVGLLAWAIWKKQWAVFWASFTLVIITIGSFGVPKIHDGFDSIFSPYERMFLALPVSVFFLMLSAKWNSHLWVAGIFLLGVFFYWRRVHSVEERAIIQLSQDKEHILPYAKSEDVYKRLNFLQHLTDSLQVNVVLMGPGTYYLDGLAQVAHLDLRRDLHIVDPSYDRKTWLLREVDQPKYNRFLWLQTEMSAEELALKTDLEVSDIEVKNAAFREGGYYYLIEGEGLNPIELYRKAGYSVCNH